MRSTVCGEQTRWGFGSMRILLIDDNETNARFLEALLTLRPPGAVVFEVSREASLYEALRRIDEDGPFDAILLDLGLPECGGLTTLKLVRSHAPAMPVVVVTGNDHPETIREANQIGARDYLVKGRFGGSKLERALIEAVAPRPDLNGLAGQPELGGLFFAWGG